MVKHPGFVERPLTHPAPRDAGTVVFGPAPQPALLQFLDKNVVVAVLEAEFNKCVMLLKMPKAVLTLHSQGQHIEQLLLHVQPARQPPPRTPVPRIPLPPLLVRSRARSRAASHTTRPRCTGRRRCCVRSTREGAPPAADDEIRAKPLREIAPHA